ncbi:MAG: hypothetical protein KDC53_10515 [Saprospiraceae bacterium]|nr:hypothetical protein [Saprospiraceae bacterium]
MWTGLYARPDLYNAKMEVEEIHNMSGLSHALSYLTDPNAMGNSIDLVHKAKGLKLDMERIFRMNTCNCDALKRFEENLIRFALDQTSIRMEGASKYSEVKSSGGPSGTQDFNKLVDDLIRDQAKTWMMNRYQSGSISDVDITKNDQGKPRSLRANYRFSGFGGSSSGSVKIVFKDGLPTCMYFWDFPNNCKTPSMSIVAGYAQGNYGI